MANKECPTGAITSFPLQLGITATSTLYDTVQEPITLDIQWSTRSTPPMFVYPKIEGVTDEVGAGNTNLTTLRFMNNTYIVSSVQIIKASHTAWLLPSTSMNFEDIAITFSTSTSTTQYAYITFVIPIIRTSALTNPNYLTGLSDSNSNGPFSLQSCFPTNPQARFAYYSTCLKGYSLGASTQSSYVFVCTDGIQASTTLMSKLLDVVETTEFKKFSPPYMNRLTSNTMVIKTVGDFTTYVMTTTQLLNYKNFAQLYPTTDTLVRRDDVSAYQCVAIDPDSAIVDGKINVDVNSGEVLTDVLSKRDNLRADHNVTASMNPGRLEKHIGTALGIILSILLFTTILYLVFSLVYMPVSADIQESISSIPRYGILILITGFIGFIIGTMLN